MRFLLVTWLGLLLQMLVLGTLLGTPLSASRPAYPGRCDQIAPSAEGDQPSRHADGLPSHAGEPAESDDDSDGDSGDDLEDDADEHTRGALAARMVWSAALLSVGTPAWRAADPPGRGRDGPEAPPPRG